MFFYRFGSSFSRNIVSGPSLGSKPGDIIFDGHSYFLNLGEEIAWVEQGYESITISPYEVKTSVLNDNSLQLIHRMVNERYSSYSKIIPLWLGNDIEKLLSYRPTTKAKKSPQTLLVFPSLFALSLYRNQHKQLSKASIVSGSSTNVQKLKNFRNISTNTTTVLLCTHSQVFQNRNFLTRIHLFDAHSHYYRSLQDPRYRIDTTLRKMKEIYHIQEDL